MNRAPARLLTLFLLVLALGCADQRLHVGGIQVGRALNADGTVAKFTTAFKPNDTIYVSIATTNLGSGTLTVKWSFNGRLLSESSKPVSFKIAGATEFHIQSTSGFPPGPYSVEVLLDGTPVGTRPFTVEPD